MGNLQGAGRTAVIAVAGFLSLIVAIICLCFCLFAVYNFFYRRTVKKHMKMKDSWVKSETQSTDIETSSNILECETLLHCRSEHPIYTSEETRL